MPTRSRNTAPIHTWVLALLVAMCLAFGLSPFFGEPLSGTSAAEANAAAGTRIHASSGAVGVGLAAAASVDADAPR